MILIEHFQLDVVKLMNFASKCKQNSSYRENITKDHIYLVITKVFLSWW